MAQPAPRPHPERTPDELLEQARRAFLAGEYARADDLLVGQLAAPAASALRIRALANLDAGKAERAGAEALERHPLCVEIHYLYGVLLLGLGQDESSARALRRALYLDRSLAVAHSTLGSILERRGDLAGARRAYRNARDLCAARPPDEIVPLADGERAGRLAAAMTARLSALGDG